MLRRESGVAAAGLTARRRRRAGALQQRLAELAVQTRSVREIADEIAAGRFDTADQAAEAWHSRFMQSLGPKPATRRPRR